MKIKEIRRTTVDTLRATCIRQNWFTRADNEEYYKFLTTYGRKQNLTKLDIYKAAKEVEKFSRIDADRDTASIMYEIADACFTCYEIEEE